MVTEARAGRLMQKRKLRPIEADFNQDTLARLSVKGADEDQELANAGLGAYARRLEAIDTGE